MACVSLQHVRLFRATGECHGLEAGEQLAQMDLQLEVGVSRPDSGASMFQVVANAGFKFRPSSVATKVIATIECAFELLYAVHEGDLLSRLTDEDLLQFASLNGIRNVWPYMREYCQSVLARMQLPQFTLPSFAPGNFRPPAG